MIVGLALLAGPVGSRFGFVVPDAKWSRLTTVYSPETTGGIRPMKDPESFGNTVMSPIAYYKDPKTYYSGGAGLASTARRS